METLAAWIKELADLYGRSFAEGVATLVIGWVLAVLLRAGLRRTLRTARIDATLSRFCANLLYVSALTIVVIAALERFGLPPVSVAAVLGAAGLAVGLALKGTLSDLAAGIMLIALRPFKVGDRIEVAGASGIVRHIHVFATILETEDDKRTIIVPNARITGSNITTFTTE